MVLIALLTLQATCVYPANPAGQTRDMRRTLAEECRRAIKADPHDLKAYSTLGYALLDSPAEALRVYQDGLAVDPDNYEFQFNAGLCLRQLHRLSEALSALERAATLDGSRPEDALVEAGLVAHQLQTYVRAELLFRDALRRAPDSRRIGHTWGYLARSLYRQGKYREAVEAWDRADQLSPRGFIDQGGDRASYKESRRLASKGRP